jgi:hypothetical protein
MRSTTPAIDDTDLATMTFATRDEADQAVDLANRAIGRELAGRLPSSGAEPKKLASEVLRSFGAPTGYGRL